MSVSVCQARGLLHCNVIDYDYYYFVSFLLLLLLHAACGGICYYYISSY